MEIHSPIWSGIFPNSRHYWSSTALGIPGTCPGSAGTTLRRGGPYAPATAGRYSTSFGAFTFFAPFAFFGGGTTAFGMANFPSFGASGSFFLEPGGSRQTRPPSRGEGGLAGTGWARGVPTFGRLVLGAENSGKPPSGAATRLTPPLGRTHPPPLGSPKRNKNNSCSGRQRTSAAWPRRNRPPQAAVGPNSKATYCVAGCLFLLEDLQNTPKNTDKDTNKD